MISLKERIFGSPKSSQANSRYPNGTQRFVPVSEIADGLIVTEDRRYIKILEVLPTNFYLKSDVEQRSIIDSMAAFLKIAPASLQFLVVTRQADIDAYCENMRQYYESEPDPTRQSMILDEAQLVNQLATEEAVTRRFYIAYAYDGTSAEFADIAEEMAQIARTACQYLDACGLEILQHPDYNEFLFRTVYDFYHKDADTDYSALLSQVGTAFGAANIPAENLNEEAAVGTCTVQDILAPNECDLTHKNYLLIDGLYRAYLYIAGYGYPTVAGLSWLAPLIEVGPGVSVSFFLNRKDKAQILKKISNTTRINRSRMRDVEDTRTDFEELDDAVSSGLYIKDQLNREGEDFYYMHVLIEVTASDTDTLEQRLRQVENRCTSMRMTARRAEYCHEQGFRSMLPLVAPDADLERRSRRNVLTAGAAAAFPFSSYELCDSKGVLLGINLYNDSMVLLDNFNNDLYSNGNLSLFGMSGAGKTFTLMMLAKRWNLAGVQVFIIAPEKGFEYRPLCDAMGGQYIKLARGSADRVNIMDIRRTNTGMDDDMTGRADSVMLDAVQTIRTYLRLHYPSMTPEEGYLLNAAIIRCYERFGITADNASLQKENGQFKRMPDLSDLYSLLCEQPALSNVSVVVKDLLDSGLAGQTNVNLRSSFIVLDTSSARDEDLAALTFIATALIRDEMTRSRTRKKAVFGDELWVIAGKEGNEQAADFVINMVKTIRGYGGVFVSATQNVIDYFALRDGKFGDALLGNSRLKLLLQMEEQEAVKLRERLGLSEQEVIQILRCGRGQGLLCAGKNRIAVEMRASQSEYLLFTTDRTALEKKKGDL